MTRRGSTIRRRAGAEQELCIGTEMAAAGMLWGWFRTAEWSTRRFWASIGSGYGERIDTKVREALPGCRPGYRYALGEYPPLPLLEEIPADHLAQREQLVIEGTRHWHVGEPWQKCQADHLRDLGEIDGAEWRRYLRWRDAGYPAQYVCDADPTKDRPTKCIAHLCW